MGRAHVAIPGEALKRFEGVRLYKDQSGISTAQMGEARRAS